MEIHQQLTDNQFEQQFRDCTIDPAVFTHEAHLRLAWIHIRQYGVEQAISNICTQLQNFTRSLGAADKYNTTLTIVAIRAVDHFYHKSNATSFNDFITAYPRLKHNFRELIAAHYGFDIFQSEEAKRQYLQPDLLPFT